MHKLHKIPQLKFPQVMIRKTVVLQRRQPVELQVLTPQLKRQKISQQLSPQ
jgi:hypothetical protein